jgi:alpha-ketoglutarate-dependent taurine dioxygenase
MLTIEPTGAVLGATVRGIDLARPLREPDLGRILLALGKHGVLRFPDQHLDLGALKRFAEQFGAIQGGGNRYTNVWAENDLLVWDHLGTLHRAIADYGPDEIRLIRRCQVMATKVFDPEFLRPARELATAGID